MTVLNSLSSFIASLSLLVLDTGAGADWIGKSVIPKRPDVPVVRDAAADSDVVGTLNDEMEFTVRGAHAHWLQLKRGWVARDAVIKAEDAVDFFTAEIARHASSFAHSRRGYAHAMGGSPAEALADANEAIRLDESCAAAYFCRAIAYGSLGKADLGLAAILNAVRLDPENATLRLECADALLAAGDPLGAITHCDKAIQIDGNDSRGFTLRGNAHQAIGRRDLAFNDYTTAIQSDPGDARAYCFRGILRTEAGEYVEAVRDFDDAIRLEPDVAGYHHQRGMAWLAKEDYDRAIADFSGAIKIDATFAIAFIARGTAFLRNGKPEQSLTDLSEGIRLMPTSATAFVNRALSWQRLGNLRNAIDDCNHAIWLEPNNAGAYFYRAGVWDELGQFAKAMADYDEAIRLAPRDPRHYHRRGVLLLRMEYIDGAINDFDLAIALSPDGLGPYVDRATAWGAKRDFRRAIEDLDRVIRLDSKCGIAYTNRAAAFIGVGGWEAAIRDAATALEIEPTDVTAMYNRSVARFRKGDHLGAIADLENAIAVDPSQPQMQSALALLLAYCPDEAARDRQRGVALARQACNVSAWKDANCIATLAAAYAAVGDFDAAVGSQLQAVDLLPHGTQIETVARGDLDSYRQRTQLNLGNRLSEFALLRTRPVVAPLRR